MCVLFPPSKTKSITLHNLLINLSWGSAKVMCYDRFSFLLPLYDVNMFNDWIDILDYLEFVVIRKKFRFTMKIFYLGVNKFK